MGLAFLVAARSRDLETQHGCVIVDEDRIILGTGYNSLPKGLNDSQWPTTRPEKYPFMIHAEENAILNLGTTARHRNATVYVTGHSCNNCFQRLIQTGIKRLVMAERQGTRLEDEQTAQIFARLAKQSDIQVEKVTIDLGWAKAFLSRFRGPNDA